MRQKFDTPVVREAIAEIFNRQSAIETDTYFCSAAYELRKALDDNGQRLFRAAGEAGDQPVDDFLRGLPRYEACLLSDIIHCDQPVTVIRGGTGSGKSSILAMLRRMLPVYVSSRRASRDVEQPLPCDDLVAVVDLQNPSADLQNPVEDLAGRASQFAKLARSILDRLFADLHAVVSREALTELILTAFSAPTRATGSTSLAVIHAVRFSIESKRGAPLEQLEVSAVPVAFEEAVNDLAQPQMQLHAALLPYLSLCAELEKQDAFFFVAFDNLDALPTYLQTEVWECVQALFSPELRSGAFRLLLFLRISSSIDSVAALPNPLVLSHACVNPSDVVLHRCVKFLASPAAFSRAHNLPQSVRTELKGRIALLALTLHDRDSMLSASLASLSGSNIRNAFSQVQEWLVHPELLGSLNPKRVFKDVTKNLSYLLCSIRCEDVGEWFVHGVRCTIADDLFEEAISSIGGNPDGVKILAKRIGALMITVALECLHDGGFFAKAERDEELEDVPRRSPLDVDSVASTFNAAKAEKVLLPSHSSALNLGLRQLVRDWNRRYMTVSLFEDDPENAEDRFVAVLKAIGKQFSDNLPNELRNYCADNELQETPASKWKTLHFSRGVRDFMTNITKGTLRDLDRTDSVLADTRMTRRAGRASVKHMRKLLQATSSVPSRYDLARTTLLSVTGQTGDASEADEEQLVEALFSHDPKDRFSAVNPFTLGSSVCPIVLKILSLLDSAGSWNATFASILELKLLRYGFTSTEFYGAVTEMVRRDRRLVFSTSEDETLTARRLLGEKDRL